MSGIRLQVLGSGNCVIRRERGAAAYLVEAGGITLLLDCGSGTLAQLARCGRDFRAVDLVCLSHYHPDHAGDLAILVQALDEAGGPGRRLVVAGNRRIGAFYRQVVTEMLGGAVGLQVEVVDLEQGYRCGAVEVTSHRAEHAPGALMLAVGCGGRRLVYTGDTAYFPGAARFAAGADLLVADCTMPAGMAPPGHMDSAQCGRLAREAGARRLLLSHFSPEAEPAGERRAEAAVAFAGEILAATDFLTVEI